MILSSYQTELLARLDESGLCKKLDEEYAQKDTEKALLEAQSEFHGVETLTEGQIYRMNMEFQERRPELLEEYHEKVFLSVFHECLYEIYEQSLVIDDDKLPLYRKSLKENFIKEVNEITKDTFYLDYPLLFENAVPIVQQAILLAESKANEKLVKIDKDEDAPIPEEVLLDEKDREDLEWFRKLEGSEDISKEINEKMVTVLKGEQERMDEEKERMEDLKSEFKEEGGEDKTIEESISRVSREYDYGPQNLFHAIVMNRSKANAKVNLNENNSSGIVDSKEMILSEATSIYLLLETFNTLQMVKYKSKDVKELADAIY